MDVSSRLALLGLQIKDDLRDSLEFYLSPEEHQTYVREYKTRIEFSVTTLSPNNHVLARSPTPQTATVLDAMVTQTIFGRELMMNQDWFREIHSAHAERLDELSQKMPRAMEQMRNEIFFGSSSIFPESTPTNSDSGSPIFTATTNDTPILTPMRSGTPTNAADDLLQMLKKHAKETADLDDKHERELNDQFEKASAFYPGLSGVLCGVRQSFRNTSDRGAEKTALINATMEYIARFG